MEHNYNSHQEYPPVVYPNLSSQQPQPQPGLVSAWVNAFISTEKFVRSLLPSRKTIANAFSTYVRFTSSHSVNLLIGVSSIMIIGGDKIKCNTLWNALLILALGKSVSHFAPVLLPISLFVAFKNTRKVNFRDLPVAEAAEQVGEQVASTVTSVTTPVGNGTTRTVRVYKTVSYSC